MGNQHRVFEDKIDAMGANVVRVSKISALDRMGRLKEHA